MRINPQIISSNLVFCKLAKSVSVVVRLVPRSSDHDIIVAFAVAVQFEAVL